MNRSVNSLFLFLSLFLFCGCEKELVEDMVPPYVFFLIVEDAETGADLLDPETEGNLLSEEVYAEAFGKKYYIWNIPGKEQIGHRYRMDLETYNDKYALCFGSVPYDMLTTITFHWNDGTQTQVACFPSRSQDSAISVDGELFYGQVAVLRK